MRWLDVLLLLAAALLVLSGPVIALQEFAKVAEHEARVQDARMEAQLTGQPYTPPSSALDFSHRAWGMVLLPLLTLTVVVLGSLLLVRVNARRRVRAVARRPGLVLLAGIVVSAAACFVDWAFGLPGPYIVRAATVSWMYPLAGALVAGAGYQLAVLEDTFAPLTANADVKDDPGGFALPGRK